MKALYYFAMPGTGYPLMQCHVPEEEKSPQPLTHENLKTSKFNFVQRQKPRNYKARQKTKQKLHVHFQKSEGSVLSLHFILYQHS